MATASPISLRLMAGLLSLNLALTSIAPAQEPQSLSASTAHCIEETVKTSFLGTPVVAHIVDAELRSGKVVMKSLSNYDPEALYIGVANGYEGSHHYYLVVGDKRFDGFSNYHKPVVHIGHPLGSTGVMFKVPVPKEVSDAIQLKLQSGKLPRGFSCLHSLCSLLKSEGVEIQGTKEQVKIRTKVVAASLLSGKIKIRGRDLDPADIQFLTHSKGEIERFLYHAETVDQKMTEKTINVILRWTTGLGLFSTIIILVDEGHKRSRPTQQERDSFRHQKKSSTH